ncbi:hypothetical protein AB833_05025 [Chromatiales bacterium (ex Bugula neritina AB1)]|nr:hypothetical protein AB833_05025 [Chromatiales bacterium (ex Bugula neritina AB1)]
MAILIESSPNTVQTSSISINHQPSTIAMMGDGFYSSVSLGPKAVIDKATALVLKELAQLPLSQRVDAPIVLADYGAADGGTSLDLINTSVSWLREHYPALPVCLYYTDLPGADFGNLFRMLNGENTKQRSPVTTNSNVHAFCTGMSFYQQLLPNGTLDLGFSASAMHYLSTMPGSIANHVHAVGATTAENELYRMVALNDWETILLQRSRELRKGGRLVMANFCIDERGQHLGNTGGVNLFDTYNSLWASMRDDGVITAEEYARTAFQQYYKSIEDTLMPFQQATNPVRQSGLRLEHYETAIVQCPFRLAFERGELPLTEFAAQFVNTHRSWTETTFRAGISTQRSPAEVTNILDELYTRYEQTVLQAPHGHGKDLLHVYLVARKAQMAL